MEESQFCLSMVTKKDLSIEKMENNNRIVVVKLSPNLTDNKILV